MIGCQDVELFFDRELPEESAEAFRDHLAGCRRCQMKLGGLMQEAVSHAPADERTKRT